jgi:hypothetical protein
VVVGKQTVRQAARLAASQVQAKYRRERVEHDRRLERLAVEVLTACRHTSDPKGSHLGTVALRPRRPSSMSPDE